MGIDWPVKQFRGYLLLIVEDLSKLELAQRKLAQVLGVNWYAPAQRLKYKGFDKESVDTILRLVEDVLCKLADLNFVSGNSFRVDVRRSDKRFPGISVELERDLGAKIIEHTPWQKVNLKKPDQVFSVEIQPGEVFIHSERIKGAGGITG